MKITEFSGNFFEIGNQTGNIYEKNGKSFDSVKIDKKLLAGQLAVYKQHYPGYLEELRGIAKAGNYDEEKVYYEFLCGEILFYRNRTRSCSIFGVQNDATTIVGRNYDWHPVCEKLFQVYTVKNPERHTFLAITDMGIDSSEFATSEHFFYYADDAINEKGLFIGLTFAFNDKWSYGIASIHMTRYVAENCATVKEAVNVFETIPVSCPKNFFIADAYGDMAVVEHTSKIFKVVRPHNGVLIQTNHYVDQELAKEDTVFKLHPDHNTMRRYEKLSKNAQNTTFDSVIDVLGNTKAEVCQNFPDLRSIWTISLDMKNKKYKLYWNLFGKREEMTLHDKLKNSKVI